MSYTKRTPPRFLMRVWDAPTRLFHWGVVLLIAFSYVSIKRNWIELHQLSGYTILTLLLWRLAWGFVGSETSRFRTFLRSPVEGLRHIAQFGKREPDVEIGHNAAGGWMVLALLAVMATQVGTGLLIYSDADGAYGPLGKYVTPDQGERIAWFHGLFFWVVVGFIAVHVLAVCAYYAVKRQNLLWPMISGRKRLPGNMRQPRMASPLLAILVVAVAAACVWAVVRFA